MIRVPSYNDGIFKLYKLKDDGGIYPKEKLEDTKMNIQYRELNIFDSLKMKFQQSQIEVQLKIAIPIYREINSRHILKIGNEFYTIFNVVHVTTKDGFQESELTLIKDEGINKRFMDKNS